MIIFNISDHLGNFIFICNKTNTKSSKDRPVIRLFNNKNLQAYRAALSAVDWSVLYANKHADEAYTIFSDQISKLFNTFFPLLGYRVNVIKIINPGLLNL